VRRLIGYDRYEFAEEQTLIEAIYQDWRLYVNFFQPVLKLWRNTEWTMRSQSGMIRLARPFSESWSRPVSPRKTKNVCARSMPSSNGWPCADALTKTWRDSGNAIGNLCDHSAL
jgi:hypothetical protein